MSLERDIKKLLKIKKEFFYAIKRKGVVISSNAIFEEYPKKIDEISSGGKQVIQEFSGTTNELAKVFDVKTIYNESSFQGITQQILEIENTSKVVNLIITIDDGGITKLETTVGPEEKQAYELNTSSDLVINAFGSYTLVYKLSGY